MATNGKHAFYSTQEGRARTKMNKLRVSSGLDRTIVTHLRGQQEYTKSIFSCYSETGEKFQDGEVLNHYEEITASTQSLTDRKSQDASGTRPSGKGSVIHTHEEPNGSVSPNINSTVSRETTHLANSDVMTHILDGEVHAACPGGKSTIYLYIVSENTDMETELAAFQDHLYPQLREHFRQRGHELRILDLHWGLKDTVSDDHGIPQVFQRAINKAHDSRFGVNFVILLGQKYGPYLLPKEIPKAEYEGILKAATDYKKKQKQIIRTAIAEAVDEHEAAKDEEEMTFDNDQQADNTAIGDAVNTGAASDVGKEENETNIEEHTDAKKKHIPGVTSKRDQKYARMLRDAEDQLPDTKALRQWYILDENSIPAVYRLQNISTHLTDIVRNNAAKRQMAKLAFASIESRLQKVLKMFSIDTTNDPVDLRQQTGAVSQPEPRRSVLEQEVHSVCQHATAADHSVCVFRTLDHLTENLDDLAASDHVDLAPGSEAAVDEDKWAKMEAIKQTVLNYQTDENRLATYSVEWTSGGIRPDANRTHAMYTDRMCKMLFDQIVSHPDLKNHKQTPVSWRHQLLHEVLDHVRMCQESARGIQGSQPVLNNIRTYLLSDIRQPLVVHGKCGCGKSSILSAAAINVHTWLQRENVKPHVVVRMIGCTTNSTNIRTLLRGISLQLCHVFDRDPMDIPTDYKGVVNDLGCRLGQASAEHPVIVIVDGVDRLTDDYDGRNLQWLPLRLPLHVHLIISMASHDKSQCLPVARKLLNENDRCFLEISQLPVDVALIALRDRLSAAKRKLTDEQWEMCKDAYRKCPLPLFLQILITEATRWRSSMTSGTVQVGESLKHALSLRFARLEYDHGETLTRRALGYISASRHGLTSNELEEILTSDVMVIDDMMARYNLPRRRLPTLLLVRLQEDIEDLILECKDGNMKTITWAHLAIAEAAEERYLSQRDKVFSLHKALAEYFTTTWIDQTTSRSSCFVPHDETYNGAAESCSFASNIRSLIELPYHLRKCQKITQLKLSCLCNYDWILARLCGTSFWSLLEEYDAALTDAPQDSEIRIVMNALILSRQALINEPRQLASQLSGRLHKIVTADNPKSPGDPKTYPSLHLLLAAAKQPSIPSLIPSMECMHEPGGIMFDVLSGHTGAVSAVTITSDGTRALTSSQDGTIKVWDISSGRVIKSINCASSKVSTIRTALNNTLAITVEGSHIKIWDINSGIRVFAIDQYIDPARISIAAEGKLLAVVYDGSNMFRSWNLDGFSMLSQMQIPEISIHKDNSILIAHFSRGDHVLHAFRSGNSATVRNARTGVIFKHLQCHDNTSSIVALVVTNDYFILCCRQQSTTQEEIHALELFDSVKGSYIRTIRGCSNDNITELTTNSIGSHAIAACPNTRSGVSDIAVFNLETEDHRHLVSHPGMDKMCVCYDFRFCVTGDPGQNYLKVWNLSPIINQQIAKARKLYGLLEIWPMVDNPRYVVTKAVNNGPISVWNVSKGKCLQSAVRIERGLTEGTDALVIRNTRLVILTDRGLSSISDNPLPVFQTVLVYDLKVKKYIRKLTGCYIVPAPSHEYTLLDSESLLGPSDNRSHFIIWSLISGHPVFRIKTAFKELERIKVDSTMNVIDGAKANRRTGAKITSMETIAQPISQRKAQAESKSAKRRIEDLRPEKENAIDQFLVSGDQKVIVASFYAHHLCVFDIQTHTHTQTLQTDYSMMLLHTSALTFSGSHLVHSNYDEVKKASYVTMWDCVKGQIKRRLKGETDVCVIGITDDAQRVVIGRSSNELHIWDPMKSHSLKRIRGYSGFKFQVNSKMSLIENGDKAIVISRDVSVWDLVNKSVLAVFTPDSRISVCKVVLNGKLILMGLYDKPELVVLKLASRHMIQAEDSEGVELFGETTGDTSDEDDNSQEAEDNDN